MILLDGLEKANLKKEDNEIKKIILPLLEQDKHNDYSEGETPQLTIPKNSWFAAQPIYSDSYSLVGCSVAPGFDFEDFELGDRDSLLANYPQHEELIKQFTRE